MPQYCLESETSILHTVLSDIEEGQDSYRDTGEWILTIQGLAGCWRLRGRTPLSQSIGVRPCPCLSLAALQSPHCPSPERQADS